METSKIKKFKLSNVNKFLINLIQKLNNSKLSYLETLKILNTQILKVWKLACSKIESFDIWESAQIQSLQMREHCQFKALKFKATKILKI